jgi:electron transport complex protein RnfG
MSEAKKQSGMASLVIVLAVICLVSAAILGLVNKVTVGPIQANTEKTVQESLRTVMPIDGDYEDVTDQYSGDPVTVDVTGVSVPVKAVYKAADEGYVVETMSPNGFGGALDMMAGVDNDGNVTGIAIISHAETSGLGSKSTDPEWQAQFKGVNGTIGVTKDGYQINAITGSTITSRAVCDGVNAAIAVVETLG